MITLAVITLSGFYFRVNTVAFSFDRTLLEELFKSLFCEYQQLLLKDNDNYLPNLDLVKYLISFKILVVLKLAKFMLAELV